MILEKQKEALVLSEGCEESSISMSLDLDSAQQLMLMLSKNLYSDPIGSTVRECASNALDSHRKANVDTPIIVSLYLNDSNSYEFSVEDFGVGLDDYDVENLISKYGKSTKRQEANQLGMFGLGFKSPLAYSSSFYFVCRKDGMERKYMMYEGESVNTIDLLYEKSTDQSNGVKIIVPVKWTDRQSFFSKIKSQLAYFENVWFECSLGSDIIKNDFKILRSQDWQVSSLSADERLHICLDNVYYPIDFDKLGIGPIYFPVGLRFNLSDGLFPIPNRESLKYSVETKNVILQKIKFVADYFVNMYNDSMKDCTDFKKVFVHYQGYRKYVTINEKVHDIHDLLSYSNFALTDVTMLNVKHLNLQTLATNYNYIFSDYECTMNVSRGTLRNEKHSKSVDLISNDNSNVLLYENTLPGIVKDYLRSLYTSYTSVKLIKKRNDSFTLFQKHSYTIYYNYYKTLGLSKIPRKNWRAAIVEFQQIKEQLLKNIKVVNLEMVPESYIASRKALLSRSKPSNVVGRRTKRQGDVIVKQATDLERYVDGKNCKFVPETLNLEKLTKSPFLHVYGKTEQNMLLDNLYFITNSKKIKTFSVSDREYKVMSELDSKNVMSFDQFMKGDNKVFKRLVTAYLINKLRENNVSVFQNYTYLKDVSTDLYDKIIKLESYRCENHKHCSDLIYKAMLEVANNKKLYDRSIYGLYLEIKETLERLTFLNSIMKQIDWKNEEKLIPCIVDLCKYHKFKLNLSCYKQIEAKEEKLEESI